MFRAAWWGSNTFLAVALLGLMYSGERECSLRRYLDGFSDAIRPNFLPPEQKVQALLLSATATIFFLIAPGMLAWYADWRPRILRFQLREHMIRAGTAFVSAPEINQ
jgi:hypothetical protein